VASTDRPPNLVASNERSRRQGGRERRVATGRSRASHQCRPTPLEKLACAIAADRLAPTNPIGHSLFVRLGLAVRIAIATVLVALLVGALILGVVQGHDGNIPRWLRSPRSLTIVSGIIARGAAALVCAPELRRCSLRCVGTAERVLTTLCEPNDAGSLDAVEGMSRSVPCGFSDCVSAVC